MRRWSGVLIILLMVAGSTFFPSCRSTLGQCDCDPTTTIGLKIGSGPLPDTCASKKTPPALTWTSADGSLLVIQIPDWGNEKPTTTINPYPGAKCDGTNCTSGTFAGGLIADCTPVRYSVTTTLGTTSEKHYGHIIIKP